MRSADYVVVGAGSSGCIVAGRLAASGASVVLLEAGGADRSRLVRTPGLVAVMHSVPQIKKRFDWGFTTTPQTSALGRRIPQVRGKVLGGSSSINGMVFVRGNRQNFDDWAADGCPGWGWDDVLPSYRRFEDWEDGEDDHRGAGGPIRVTRVHGVTPAAEGFIEGFTQVTGTKRLDDYNGAEQEGIGVLQQSAGDALRYSASVGYLGKTRAASLEVVTGAVVSRVVVENGRATGVEYLTRNGPQVVHAAQEVVLSAGVFGSAQILMLSGVGPAGHLREHGIDVAADLPVGDNLHDHMFVPLTFLTKGGRNRGTAPYFASGVIRQQLGRNTWVARSVFDAVGFVRSSIATNVPDLQVHVLPWSYPSPNQDDSTRRHDVDKRPAVTLMSTLIYPRSRGTMRLASSDPTAAPLIDPRYLADPADTEVLLDGMEMIREVMATRSVPDAVELHPGPSFTDRAALAREVPNRATTVYHPVGTCRMGSDERAVVDPLLRVRGIEGLRVADAAIMPSITGGNTTAPALMIGERAAELIAQGA